MNPFANLVDHWVYRGVLRPVTAPAYDYVLAGNGLFKRARSRQVSACIPVAPARVAGLPDLEAEVALHTGRAPGRVLYPVLDDARRYAAIGRERLVHIRLVDGCLWRVSVPRQRTGAARVDYRLDAEDSLVCDLHSHHRMRPYFSAADDRDETGFRFYAVIGDVLARPRIQVRLGMYGDFYPVPATLLFSDTGPFEEDPWTSSNA